MFFVMATVGTEGDVRPFIALALGLVRAGHRVTIATHTDYEERITSRGLGFRAIGGSFKQVVESEAGRAWIESSDSLLRYLRMTKETFGPLMAPWADDACRAAVDADVVLAHPFALGATCAAEKNGVPAMLVSLPPFVPSGEGEVVFYPTAPKWPWLRRTLGRASLRGIGSIVLPPLNEVRKGVGLAPLGSPMVFDHAMARGTPLLHLYSKHVVPRPSDWPEHAHVTGYCFLDEPSFAPEDELVRFVEQRGAPPIYIGFGSMTGKDPKMLAELTMRAVRRAGVRAVLVTGWGGVHGVTAGEDVYVAQHVPHDWLLPRVRAVVHHGGAGTTAAGLRAGKPTLVVAFFGDQMYWGHRVAQLGAGPSTLLRRKLTEESLAKAISELLATSSFGGAARRLADALATEDGVAAAVATIEQHVASARPS